MANPTNDQGVFLLDSDQIQALTDAETIRSGLRHFSSTYQVHIRSLHAARLPSVPRLKPIRP